jgi:hypothetical protein
MDRSEWITAFAERLGIEPLSETDTEMLLDLAGVAAHAAPLTCWLVGRAGITPDEALRIANELADAS